MVVNKQLPLVAQSFRKIESSSAYDNVSDKEICFEVNWPPSINKMYSNNGFAGKPTGKYYVNSKGQIAPIKSKGRRLSLEGKKYKRNVCDIIRLTNPRIFYGKQKMGVTIYAHSPDNRVRDNHNGLKILFDAIEDSGIIENDKQIVSTTLIPAEGIHKPGYWKVFLKPYKPAIIDMCLNSSKGEN